MIQNIDVSIATGAPQVHYTFLALLSEILRIELTRIFTFQCN